MRGYETEEMKREIEVGQFPGPHCGLFEAALVAPLFQSGVALVLAPPSCLYHAKLMQKRRELSPINSNDNLYLLHLEQTDMVFGIEHAVEEALMELEQQLQPEIIFLISTCTPEIIGFDSASLSEIQKQLRAKVLTIQTNGYECLHQQKGRSNFLSSLIQVMEVQKVKPKCVNILGLKSPNWEETELVQVLKNSGIEINSVLPGAASLQEIRMAPQASLNIVVGKAAKPLAEEMKNKFSTPYIMFNYSYLTEEIVGGYESMGEMLNVNIRPAIEPLAAKYLQFLENVKPKLTGIPFAVGSIEGSNIEAAIFYMNLGMIPQFVQTRRLLPKEVTLLKQLEKRGIDLRVVDLNQTKRLDDILNEYSPQIFIGHGASEVLNKRNIMQFHSNSMLGPGFLSVQQEIANIIHLIESHVEEGVY